MLLISAQGISAIIEPKISLMRSHRRRQLQTERFPNILPGNRLNVYGAGLSLPFAYAYWKFYLWIHMDITLALPSHSVKNGTKDSELPLLEAARAMNKEALVKIFDTYSPALYNYAFRLCNDALKADYIVGDVFAKLLDQFSAGNGPSTNLRSYLYEAVYHLIVDEARYSYREAPLETVEFAPYDGYSAYVNVENQIIIKAILLAIQNNLTIDQRHVIILRFLEGFSLSETAAIIGKNVNHVKVIQNRAITNLRKALEDKVPK